MQKNKTVAYFGKLIRFNLRQGDRTTTKVYSGVSLWYCCTQKQRHNGEHP